MPTLYKEHAVDGPNEPSFRDGKEETVEVTGRLQDVSLNYLEKNL